MKTLILVTALFSMNAFAWGPTGHRVVGEIAQKHLDQAVLLKVYKILGNQSLSRVSNWSDEIKSDPQTYSYTYNWHYTDWKDEDHDHDETSSSGKLITAINEQIATLKNPEKTDAEKAFALKFIVHLVGDLHQPLHVGNGLDMGGNKCKVQFHGRNTNLHSVWDEGMIEFMKLSYTELATYVSQSRTLEEIRKWRSGDVLDWALESKKLRAKIYPANVTSSKSPMSVMEYCRTDITVTGEIMPKLSFEYSYQFVPVLEQRLFQAGLRLAMILNAALK
jgi:hypothetical protein